MSQEIETKEGLNPFSEQRPIPLGSGMFRLDQFKMAEGSREQHQFLKSSAFFPGDEPGAFLVVGRKGSGKTALLRYFQSDHRTDITRPPGNLDPLRFAGGLLAISDLEDSAVIGKDTSKAVRAAGRLLNAQYSGLDFADQQQRVAAPTSNLITAVSEDPAPGPERAILSGRPTGPVQYFQRLLEAWGLDEEVGATLLGFEEMSHLRDLLRGTVSLRRRDAKDRLRYLLEIDIALNALFRNEEAIKAWLRQPLEELGSESPLDHLREGSMEHLLRLKQLVEFLSGR